MTRAFALAAAMGCGTAAAMLAPPGPWALAIAAAVLLLAAVRRGTPFLLAAALACGWASAAVRVEAVEHAFLRAPGVARIEGVVTGDVTHPGDGSVRFVVAARNAERDGEVRRVRERVLVTARSAVEAGRWVRLEASVRPAGGSWDLRRGIAARATAHHVEALPGRPGLASIAERGRRSVRDAASVLPPRDAGLLLGLTVGDTSALDARDEVAFRATGLTHLLAVSGANVAIVLAAVAVLLRLARAGPRTSAAALALALVWFMAVTRAEPSVVRAGAMAGIGLVAMAAGARRTATVALGWATVLALAWDPFLVWSVGFQLSVAATWGILALAPRFSRRLPEGRLWSAVAIGLGAQVAVTPLIALHFGRASPVSPAANLLAAPAAGPATLAGMIAATLGSLWEPLGASALLAEPFILWMRGVAHALSNLPAADVRGTGIVALALAGIALGAGVAAARRSRRVAPLALALALLAAGGTWARALDPPPRGATVTVLDVGQGEAILVRSGGATMLVDGGPDEAVVLQALRDEGVRRVDLMVITHPHQDHVAGLAAVATAMPVGRALDPAIPSGLPAYASTLRALAVRRVPVDRANAGATYDIGGTRVEVLWPPAERPSGTAEDVNNNSVVLRVGDGALLLAGEVQEEAQARLLEQPDALRARIVKVAHHGSKRMLPAFYAATGARTAVIPVGRNLFGHPAPETLAALAGMEVLRTDLHGTITLELDEPGGTAGRAA